MQVKDLGEFGVIALLNEMVVKGRGGPNNGADFDFKLPVGIGNDPAAWHTSQLALLFRRLGADRCEPPVLSEISWA